MLVILRLLIFYTFVIILYINITITILDTIHRPVFYLEREKREI
jgi:hypothetical protein